MCQNRLTGDPSEDVYPARKDLKRGSMLYKVQMFLAITVMIVALACEFLLDVKLDFHWSLLACVWVRGGEIWLRVIIHGHKNPGRVVTLNAWWAAILIMFTFIIIKDLRPIYFWYIMPAIAIAAQVLLFIFMMIDKRHNCLPYFLGCSGLCIAMGIICMLVTHEKALLWVICLMVGVVGLVGAVVFKGRSVPDELQKRFHL